MAAPVIQVLPDLEAASRAAAAHVATLAAAAITRTGRFVLALAGGHTPRRLYQILAADFRRAAPWERAELFWGDERCVPPDDARSNFGLARDTLLAGLPVRASAVHRIRGELGAAAAAAAYHDELARFFGQPSPPGPRDRGRASFDLVILGLGADGHTASLFPGHVDPDDARWAKPARPPEGQEPVDRVTVTLRAINGARRALMLAAGPEKREAFEQVKGEGGASRDDNVPPAALVDAEDGTTWFVDRAAAGV